MASQEDRGPVYATASGRPYWLVDPDKADIHLRDIPIHLSRVCRFNGGLRDDLPGIYSVAQHLCHCHDVAPSEHKLEALMHDAHEAYVQDVVRPLKLELPDYVEIEDANEQVMREFLKLPAEPSAVVKEIDQRMCATERRDLCASPKPGVPKHPAEPYPFTIRPWVPMRARREMIKRMEACGLL